MNPYNLPSTDVDNFSFGPGILYLAPMDSAGNTLAALTDIGAVRSGATFTVTRTKIEVMQGSPRTLIEDFAVEERAVLTVTGIEWNLQNLAKFFGAGITTGTTLLDFGGDMKFQRLAVKFVHRTPVGDTFTLSMWRTKPSGEVTITFGDEIHEFPVSFGSIDAASDWGGTALADGKRLFQIQRELNS